MADRAALPGAAARLIIRRGDLVQRTAGPWTPAVHALLAHLEAVGFDRAPSPVTAGPDVELLRWLPGEVPDPRRWLADDAAVVAAGRLLRRYHDAAATFPLAAHSGWDPFMAEPGTAVILCHNDFGPHNCVLRDGIPWGLIDFDSAAPGSRAWDVAATATGFVPLGVGGRGVDRPARLRLLCDAYGLTEADGRGELVGLALTRLELLRDRLVAAAGTGLPQDGLPDGHRRYYELALRLLAADRAALEAALLA